MSRNLDLPTDAPDRPTAPRRRRMRGASRAASIGLLALATIAGVRLGLDAPAVSPVSPAAIAARYGGLPPGAAAPPAGSAAMPSGEVVASAPPEVAAVPPVGTTTELPAEASALARADAIEAPVAVTTTPSIVSQETPMSHRSSQHDGGRHD
ncbi:MAG: hypothetical protein U0232_24375 [Thermomicrobiales bacterium]